MAEYGYNFWMLTFDFFKKDIKKPEDNLIILVHWLLLKNDFQVLGLGSETTIDENVQPSDILPTNWSQNETYKLQYMRDKELFLLNAVKAADSLVLNLYNVKTKFVSCSAIGNINSAVQWITDLINNKEKVFETINLIENQLIGPMKKENENKIDISTQTNNEPKKSPLLISDPPRPLGRFPEPGNPMHPFPSYGISDLNPVGGLRDFGEGMLFNPIVGRRSDARRGVPPMARFDPMHPSNPDPMRPDFLNRPNPDHMVSPDFDSDYNMFM
ncbi:proteasome inhibitor PI31 subunit [Melanaphis sacchari]|uniref:Proteasome inhibitor PI31 subunit n=1 Tax=Melanaphis sacchari TaxID=742174 RepID=A0A2H8TYE9_9HEMI|nr:proteasome inhibitor PI31 subunit [Melanaphis sacchari]